MSDSCDPYGLYSPWNSPNQNTGVGSLSLLQGNLSNPGIKPRSPTLQVDSLPAEPQRKSKNTGVGSLPLLQGIFLIQELNWGLLLCRQTLYQLSYQGNPSSVGKESACSAGDPGLIPGLERSPGERNNNLLQYSCLENSIWTEEPGGL